MIEIMISFDGYLGIDRLLYLRDDTQIGHVAKQTLLGIMSRHPGHIVKYLQNFTELQMICSDFMSR